jgi:hypothetical protein
MVAALAALALLPPLMAILAGELWPLAAILPIVAGIATVRRHSVLKAWQRELDLAFGVEERKDPVIRPLL